MSIATRPVSIDGIEFDALIDYEETYEADVPSYPTENGFEVSDTIIIKPKSLIMTLYLTETPVTWHGKHGKGSVQKRMGKLRELFFTKKPVTVTTWRETYKNMAILNFTDVGNTEVGTSREVPIAFQEVAVTHSKTTTIPDSYGRAQPTVSVGTATPSARASSGSALSGMAVTGGAMPLLVGLAAAGQAGRGYRPPYNTSPVVHQAIAHMVTPQQDRLEAVPRR